MKKTKYLIWGTVLALLVLRAFLPLLVKKYVNHTLAKIPGYRGHIEDIDLHLWRGAYEIQGLDILKIEGTSPVPFSMLKKPIFQCNGENCFMDLWWGK